LHRDWTAKRGIDFVHPDENKPKFKLGPLGNLNQVTKGLAKTIRAMADGSLDSQIGARICNGLGIMRACLETATLERLEGRLDELEGAPLNYGSEEQDRSIHRTH
jgi:hypothetical protein